jgi:hypothetical protein
MTRSAMLSCALLLIAAVASPSQTHSHAAARNPFAWARGYTLVLVDARNADELAEARDFIVSQGGTLAVTFPPRALLGWIAPNLRSKILGRHRIISIHHSPLGAIPDGFNDSETRLAIKLFNDIASGARARRAQAELRRGTQFNDSHPAMEDCSLPHPDIDRDAVIRSLRSMGAERAIRSLQSQSVRPQFFGTSDVMEGSVAVAVFLVESNGGIDQNLYNWTQADQTTAIAGIIDGLNWWVDQSRAFRLARPLQFTIVPYLADNPACQVPYEPIIHSGRDSVLWIDHIARALGGTSSDFLVNVAALNEKIRSDNRTDWAYSMFVEFNPPGTPTSFTDGRASWAYLGGPYANILYRSFGWAIGQIAIHETGHIFYACDEYFQPGYQTCSCSCAPVIRPQAGNGNCEEFSCNPNSIPCMMRVNEFALCAYTVAQIGWTGEAPRPPPTAPGGLVANANSPTQVNLVWQDTSSVEDGFQVERRGGSDGSFAQIAVVTANTVSYSDASALPNTAYSYRVRAFNTSGASSYTAEVSIITPSTPSTLTVTTVDMPDATVQVPYSRTLSASGGTAPYTWVIESGSLPAGLELSQSGTVSGTPTLPSTSNFVARVTDADNKTATKAFTLIVKPTAPLSITTRELPRGSVGTSYSQPLGAVGGQTPYTWSLQSGNLPEGLLLNQTGVISGAPERAGSFSFVLKVTDAVDASASVTLTITINPPSLALTIETESLADAVVGQDYSQTLRAAGGAAPYRWELVLSTLPEGLTLSEGGVIAGRPVSSGEFPFTVKVTDQSGTSNSRQFLLDIDPAPELVVLNSTNLALGAVGVPYRVELRATGGTEPYTWAKKKKKKFGLLPDGITLSSEGILSGTPTIQGIYNFTVRVSDSAGKQANKPFVIEIGPPPPPLAIRTELLPAGSQSIPYNAQLEAGGGASPYTWTLDSGALPPGLSLSETGRISGRPTSFGSTSFTVRVRDAVGTTSARQFFIAIGPPPPPLVIQTVQLPETSAERAYNQTLRASGGVTPYTWSLVSGSLGAGLSLSADGVISGAPVAPGNNVFVVRVTDSAQQSVQRTLAIIVTPADKLAPFGVLEVPDQGTTLAFDAKGSGWALDNIGVTRLEVLIDGQKVTDAIYGLPRPDVAVIWNSFPRAGNSGYTFTFDTTKIANGFHTLSVRLLDDAGNATIVGQRSVLIQNRVLSVLTTALTRGRKGEAYSFQMVAVEGKAPYTWVLTGGALPQGLSMNASGLISGTPAVFGNFMFRVKVTDSLGAMAFGDISLTIIPDVEPLRILSRGDLTEGMTGVAYEHQLLFVGGQPPRTWSLATGAMPPGLSLNAQTGFISGAPTNVGTFSFTVRLTDSTQTTATSETLRITVTPGPLLLLSSGALTSGRQGVSYTHTLAKAGGAPPYTWTLDSGALPPGLSLTASTGVISGTPTQTGTFTFKVKLTDSQPVSVVSAQLSIFIDVAPLVIVSAGDLTGGKRTVAYSHQLQATGGVPPYTWSVVTGALPPGLTLDANTGLISGTPTTAGTFSFTVKVTDSTSANVTSGMLRIVISL